MVSMRAASSSLLFGFGILAIGLAVVRTSNHPWIVAPLFGLTLGGLRQLIWYVLEHELLRWTWQDAFSICLGGFLALAVFEFSGLATPNRPFVISSIILSGITLATVLGAREQRI